MTDAMMLGSRSSVDGSRACRLRPMLADDPRATDGRIVVENGFELGLDEVTLFLNHQDLF